MTSSVRALIAVNAVPIVGVLFLGWDLGVIMLLYWLENGIIGFFNVMKMLAVDSKGLPATQHVAKLFMIPFFCLHYFMFWSGHGELVWHLFAEHLPRVSEKSVFPELLVSGLIWAVLPLFGSHLWSYINNYLAEEEYRRFKLETLMFQPYVRVVILHIVVLIGGFLSLAIGAPLIALLCLVGLKTFVDIQSHKFVHRKPTGKPQTPSLRSSY